MKTPHCITYYWPNSESEPISHFVECCKGAMVIWERSVDDAKTKKYVLDRGAMMARGTTKDGASIHIEPMFMATEETVRNLYESKDV